LIVGIRQRKKELAATVQPEFVSVDEAEILTGISRWTWRDYAREGKIDSTKVGARVLVPLREIRRLLEESYRPRIPQKAKKSLQGCGLPGAAKLGSASEGTA
jgi:helix-turn-helix protein